MKTELNHRPHRSHSAFGAGIAFVAFLLTGAVPGAVYGGYLGLLLSKLFFEPSPHLTLGARVVTGGGMALGVLMVMGLYLAAGAFLGRVLGGAWDRAHAPAQDTASHARNHA